jgi:hypothetical protein
MADPMVHFAINCPFFGSFEIEAVWNSNRTARKTKKHVKETSILWRKPSSPLGFQKNNGNGGQRNSLTSVLTGMRASETR